MNETQVCCCQPNEEQEKRESATAMVRDLSEAVSQLQRANMEVREHNRSSQDKTVRAILDKLRSLLEEI
jgi:FtsZ-binding cell division protein ZapB